METKEQKEYNVITFLKNHGKEILEREKYKYEPLKKETNCESKTEFKIDTTVIEYLKSKLEQQKEEVEEIRTENKKLRLNTNEEWLEKYKKYKNKYKETKKELKEVKRDLRQTKKELNEKTEENKKEIEILKRQLNKLKDKKKDTSEVSSTVSTSEQDNLGKTVNIIEEYNSSYEENSEMEIENKNIIEALERMKNVNAVIKQESNSDQEDKENYTDIETEEIKNEEMDNYPEEEVTDHNMEVITRYRNTIPKHIPIGQHNEFKEFIGSMSQGVNLNGYFLDLDNVYEEQEISRRITDWNLGMYIALMNSTHTDELEYTYNLISKTLIGKVAYWIESIEYQLKTEVLRYATDWKSMLQIFDMILKREFLGEPWIVARDQVLIERKIEIIMNLNNMKCCKINRLPEYTISFTKFFYEARFLPEEGHIYQQLYYDHLPEPYNTEITKEYNKLEPRENTLGERIRVLRGYLMRKCEEYRVQQKVKKDKKLGLREICGFTERRLVFGCEDKKPYRNYKKRYNKKKSYDKYRSKQNRNNYPYKYNRYKRKRFRKFRNTPENRRRYKNKRKFRRKPFKKKDISECKCWNCNEKGHYANKCPKLKEKKVKYINTSQFIMEIEQIKEDDNRWYEYEEFYISETDNEINFINYESSSESNWEEW